MKKIETIWHHLLFEALREGTYKHTQQDLAQEFGYSVSTVHHALRVPSEIGAIRKESKFFVLQDFQKLLLYWASVRVFERDILYAGAADAPIRDIEGLALPESVFACYSAAKQILGEPPADYDKVYFYVPPENLPAFEKRFPKGKGRAANIFALKMPSSMPRYGSWTTLPQTFVDCWNLRDWYARDFVQALERNMDSMLSPPS